MNTVENSAEHVAYKLLLHVAFIEDKKIEAEGGGYEKADRKWLLDTYAECLGIARGSKGVFVADN